MRFLNTKNISPKLHTGSLQSGENTMVRLGLVGSGLVLVAGSTPDAGMLYLT